MQTITLIANGDLRTSANVNCWAEQLNVEKSVTAAIEKEGYKVVRGHGFDPNKGHGFIDSQKYGMQVFREIDPDAPIVVVFAAWAYSHHILHGLMTHRGPILTIANWSGTWPGLVGMLNLNGSLTKAGVTYSTLFSDDFTDERFVSNLKSWLQTGSVSLDTSHVHPLDAFAIAEQDRELGKQLAAELQQNKAIMGVFDEGCMGMFNAIVPDHLMNPTGIFKERLSQSALYYEVTQVSDEEARACRDWLDNRGMRFVTGDNEQEDLTDAQILLQLKMYIAALRIADDFGCHTVGIQYQQGLKDLLPASDLVEGLLNDSDRPPVRSRDGSRILYEDQPLPHFNEVDECAGMDGLITHIIWSKLGYASENTLHDLRWGAPYGDDYVWVFLISGAVPPSHLRGGYKGTSSERQPAMYFRLGGGTVKGVSKAGHIVWSRIFIEDNRLKADLGLARAIDLPDEETARRHKLTTPQWPIMHAVTPGITREQMMARHKSNHIQVVYTPDEAAARKALAVKASMLQALGIETFLCGDKKNLL